MPKWGDKAECRSFGYLDVLAAGAMGAVGRAVAAAAPRVGRRRVRLVRPEDTVAQIAGTEGHAATATT